MPDAHDPTARLIRRYVVTGVAAAVLVAVVYLVFVRTGWGQRLDDLAFDGRGVEDPAITEATNEVLHSVTRSTLVLLTGAIVAFAFARRRWRLALVAGASITGAVVTTEVLKLHLLSRPDLDGIAGIEQNSFPSGHATIGMALSLGLVMVSPHAWRWSTTIVALVVSMTFGVGVLATGWHRPSDTVGAYLVAVVWFSFGTALLVRWRGTGTGDMGTIEARLDRRAAVLAVVLAVAAGGFVLIETLGEGSLRTVEYALEYVVVAVAILAMAAVIVIGYATSLRGVALDPPVPDTTESPAVAGV